MRNTEKYKKPQEHIHVYKPMEGGADAGSLLLLIIVCIPIEILLLLVLVLLITVKIRQLRILELLLNDGL